MSIKYRIDRQANLITNLWVGQVTAEEWHAHLREMTAHPDWPAINRLLCDLRTVKDVSTIGAAEIAGAVQIMRAAPGNLSDKMCAIPASQAFRAATAYQKAIAPYEPRVVVFSSLETALIYLGVDLGPERDLLEELRREAG
jgi:hypothetical protein